MYLEFAISFFDRKNRRKRCVIAAMVKVLLFCIPFSTALKSHAECDLGQIVGNAHDSKTGELLYIEEHGPRIDAKQTIIYREKNGDSFAEKSLDFSVSEFAPSVVQVNNLAGEKIVVEVSSDNRINASYREDREAKTKAKSLAPERLPVIDAGFDNVLRDHWLTLINGETLEFDYFVPSRLSSVALKAEAVACDDEDSVCFKVSAANWLLRALIKPLNLTYSASCQRLIRFVGTSNIADAEGNYQFVDIRYEYLDTSLVSQKL